MDDKIRNPGNRTISISGFDRRRFMAGAAGTAVLPLTARAAGAHHFRNADSARPFPARPGYTAGQRRSTSTRAPRCWTHYASILA
jgi:hypothetical protein